MKTLHALLESFGYDWDWLYTETNPATLDEFFNILTMFASDYLDSKSQCKLFAKEVRPGDESFLRFVLAMQKLMEKYPDFLQIAYVKSFPNLMNIKYNEINDGDIKERHEEDLIKLGFQQQVPEKLKSWAVYKGKDKNQDIAILWREAASMSRDQAILARNVIDFINRHL